MLFRSPAPNPASIPAVPGAQFGSLSQRVIVSGPGSRGAVLWAWEAEREGGEGDGRWGQVAPAWPQGCLVRGDGARRGPPVGALLPGRRPDPTFLVRGAWTYREKEAGQAVWGAEVKLYLL